jgi:two-component system phosphate regulon response regulator OmpR
MTGPPPHLLIVDDDNRIRNLLRKFLIRQGFLVSVARDAAHARRVLAGLEFDLIVLDVMMPGEGGLDLTRALRKSGTTPILLLTARGETTDRIEGFEAGADDYLPKPFEPRELLLRINAILRRMPEIHAEEKQPRIVQMGQARYDIERGELSRGGVAIKLTATEVQLMRIFADHPPAPQDRGRPQAAALSANRARRGLHAQPRLSPPARAACRPVAPGTGAIRSPPPLAPPGRVRSASSSPVRRPAHARARQRQEYRDRPGVPMRPAFPP